MNDIINEDFQMRSLLKTLGSEDPGDDFTDKIMAYISSNIIPVARPFRLKKSTLLIFGLIFLASQLLTVVAILNSGKGSTVLPSTNYNEILNIILDGINKLIPAEFVLITVCLFWILFVSDLLMKRSKLAKHN